jgi:hypothetical protein
VVEAVEAEGLNWEIPREVPNVGFTGLLPPNKGLGPNTDDAAATLRCREIDDQQSYAKTYNDYIIYL